MRTSGVIAVAGLAAASEAILLPPGSYAVNSEEPTFKALPFEIAPSAEKQVVEVNCPGCPIVVKGEPGLFRAREGDSSHLELDFAIDHAASGDRLLLNGFELYPEADPLGPLPLRAPVKPDVKDAVTQSLPIDAQDLGYSLRVNPAVAVTEDGRNHLVAVDLQVIEIGNTFVQGLDSVHLKMIKKPETGALMIAQIEKGESENPAPKPSGPCTTLMCALRGGMSNMMNQMRPHRCNHPGHQHHQMGNFANMMGHGGQGHAHHHGEHKGHKSGGHHSMNDFRHSQGAIHHHPQRNWTSLFKQFAYSIVVPILIGIVAGISVSVVGLIAGITITGLWRVFVRGKPFMPTRSCPRRRSGTSHNKAAPSDAAFVEEKAGLMSEVTDDAPPVYTDEDKQDSV